MKSDDLESGFWSRDFDFPSFALLDSDVDQTVLDINLVFSGLVNLSFDFVNLDPFFLVSFILFGFD